MVGFPALGGWIVEIVFWALLGLGVFSGELKPKTVLVMLGLWAAGYFGLPRSSVFGSIWLTPYVAVLDLFLLLTRFAAF